MRSDDENLATSFHPLHFIWYTKSSDDRWQRESYNCLPPHPLEQEVTRGGHPCLLLIYFILEDCASKSDLVYMASIRFLYGLKYGRSLGYCLINGIVK